MNRLATLTVLMAVLVAGISPAIAAVDPPKVQPKGLDGPDIR